MSSSLWANVSKLDPTFYQHHIRFGNTFRAAFDNSHDLRELYVSGHAQSRFVWDHLDSFEPLKSTISDNVAWLSDVVVNDKRDAAYIKLARKAFAPNSQLSRRTSYRVVGATLCVSGCWASLNGQIGPETGDFRDTRHSLR
ncbi:BQ2448_6573 [Microbotryum intermedium]|uniref:BQ2448_6573 protein n=1 Tax=Microbotryum intermedium TaxID=269621 RepID=A0A238FPL4_9BASI|nr:BQ2448_6573 [Microbotryum intermedium]